MRLSLLLAVACLFVSVVAHADRASSFYHQAMALKKQRKIEAAIAKLKDALRERKDYAAAHRSLGILYRRHKKLNKAIFHLEKASKLESSSGQAFYSLGLAYYAAGHKKKALAALDRAASLDPKNARLVASLGALVMRVDPEQALRHLKKAIALDGKNPKHYHQLGVAYRRAAARAQRKGQKAKADGYMKEAEKQLLVSLRMNASRSRLHFDLGVLYRRLGKVAKAIEHYKRATILEPSLAAAWWDLGHMYKMAKQKGDAVKAFKKYIALRGGTASARVAEKRIQELGK